MFWWMGWEFLSKKRYYVTLAIEARCLYSRLSTECFIIDWWPKRDVHRSVVDGKQWQIVNWGEKLRPTAVFATCIKLVWENDYWLLRAASYMTDALQLKHKSLLFADTAIISTLNKLSTFVSLVQYAVVKAIFSNLTHKGCPMYQIYQVQYLLSQKPSFWGYKIIK